MAFLIGALLGFVLGGAGMLVVHDDNKEKFDNLLDMMRDVRR